MGDFQEMQSEQKARKLLFLVERKGYCCYFRTSLSKSFLAYLNILPYKDFFKKYHTLKRILGCCE